MSFTSIRELTPVARVFVVHKATSAYLTSFVLSQPPARYWQDPQQEGAEEKDVVGLVKEPDQALQRKDEKTQTAKKRKQEEEQRDGKKFISGV